MIISCVTICFRVLYQCIFNGFSSLSNVLAVQMFSSPLDEMRGCWVRVGVQRRKKKYHNLNLQKCGNILCIKKCTCEVNLV